MNCTNEIEKKILSLRDKKEVFPIEIDSEERQVWVKFGRPTGSNYFYKIGYKLLKFPFLRPVQKKSATQSIQFEANKLQRLYKKALRVPRVICLEDDYFIMSDTGESISNIIKSKKDKRDIEPLIWQSVELLSLLHNQNEYHGASQIRNFTVSRTNFVYIIDFEESFEDESNLKALQFRDIFLLLYSLHRQRVELNYLELFTHYTTRSNNQEFLEQMESLYLRFNWLIKFMGVSWVQKRLGSDAKILYNLFKSLNYF